MQAEQGFDSRFRPLLSATIGSGLVAIALLDFTANGWEEFPEQARVLIAVAARSAFLMFVMNTVALLAAYLAVRIAGPVTTVCLNLYGAGTFLGGTFVVGSLLSQALDLASPGAASPPEGVQVFIGLAGVGLAIVALLVTGAASLRAISLWRQPARSTTENDDDVA